MNDDNARSSGTDMRSVDVIVPVWRDAPAAHRLLASVLAARNGTPHAVILVVDPAIEREFAAQAADSLRDARITLLRPGRPLDYASAINRGLAAHDERDVVLLQADAEVHGDWLDRLASHARAIDVGVVATFTNAAGIATYPRSHEANGVPADSSAASLDAHFARVNRGRSGAASGVFGPCLYLARRCIDAIDGMRAIGSADDCGCEIDLSLRAASAGFRSLIAGDVFVANTGEGSLGDRVKRLGGHAATASLVNLHPAYADALRVFGENDPTRLFACRVDLARLAASGLPAIVFVAHAWGGGIRRHMDDLAALVAERANVLYLEPAGEGSVRLYWPRAGESFAARFALPDDTAVLADVLRAIGTARLHFHHVHGLPRPILELPRATGLPYDWTLHDYVAVCPQYHLVDEHGRYCGEPDAAGCAACLAKRPAQWDLDIAAWRGVFGDSLRHAERVIAPSQDVATRMRRYFPGLAIAVWSHPEAVRAAPAPVVRVVTLGNLSPEKGLRVIAACANDARIRGLPLTFRILGATTEPIAQSPDAPLTVHGSYDESRLPELLAAERADVLFFPAQVAETYSYALSAALATDAPIVASALGAFPERLAGRRGVALLPFDASAAHWNAALLDAATRDLRSAPQRVAPPERPLPVAS